MNIPGTVLMSCEFFKPPEQPYEEIIIVIPISQMIKLSIFKKFLFFAF